MSKRTDIRNALKAVVETIDGFAPARVFAGRRRSIPENLLPAICIYLENEEKTRAGVGSPLVFDRDSAFVVEIHVQAATAEAVETALDTHCQNLETALLADETLGGLSREILPGVDEYALEEDSRRPGGVAKCRYSILHTA